MPNVFIYANTGSEKLNGLGYTGRNFGVSHSNGWLPLQQCYATAQPVIVPEKNFSNWNFPDKNTSKVNI